MMSVTLQVPSILAKHTGGSLVLDAQGATLGEVVHEVSLRYPELGSRLRDGRGEVYPYITVYVNDEDVRFLAGFSTPLRDGDVVTVVPAVAGG